MKKPVKLGLWLLGFALLPVVGLWLEHERAKARLAAYKAHLVAKGEKLAIADHVPKLPPALSNAAPDFIAAANRLTELKPEFQPQWMRLVAPGKARVTWQQIELPTDKDADLWPIVTAHVEENRVRLAEMAAALERPEMVFDLEYSKGWNLVINHVSKVRLAADHFALAAVGDMHPGQTNSAFSNLLASLRIAQLFREPLLISQLVRHSGGHSSAAATWEILQAPAWTESQLGELQASWQAIQAVDGWVAAIVMERSFAQWGFAEARSRPALLEEMQVLGGVSFGTPPRFVQDPLKVISIAVPMVSALSWKLWFSYPDERRSLETCQILVEAARRAQKADAFQAAQARMAADLKFQVEPGVTMLLSRRILGSMEKPFGRFAQFETVRRLTFTAIALHRHRLKHGNFPVSLGALVPEFLAEVPRDFMDGQPLRYKLQPDGQFLLWSVGEDFKDDRGDPTSAT